MKRKIIGYTLAAVVCYLLETMIPLTFLQVKPEYVFCIVCVAALFEKERFGAFYGLCLGLLCDFSGGGVFGVRGVYFMLAAYAIGLLADTLISVNLFGLVTLTMTGLALYEGLLFVFYLFLADIVPSEAFLYVILPKLLLTLPVAFLVYPIGKRISA